MKEAGVYRDWAEGLTTAEKGGMRFEPLPDLPGCNFGRYDNKPLRVVTEMREIRKYPHADGWILEKWFPASAYGTQEEWYSYKAIDGIHGDAGTVSGARRLRDDLRARGRRSRRLTRCRG